MFASTGASRSSLSLRCITAPTSGRVTITTTSAAAATGIVGELEWIRPRSATTRDAEAHNASASGAQFFTPAACSAEK